MRAKIIHRRLHESAALLMSMTEDSSLQTQISLICSKLLDAFQNGRRVYLCGTGGSAADAEHLAAEFSGRFRMDRPPLPCEALHVNSAFITAVANDYGFEHVFSRAVTAFCQPLDVLLLFTTSGNSINVVEAAKVAQELDVTTVVFTGQTQSHILPYADILIQIPSNQTAFIQEASMVIGHTICQIVEQELFG